MVAEEQKRELLEFAVQMARRVGRFTSSGFAAATSRSGPSPMSSMS